MKVRDYLTPDEIRLLTSKSDLRAAAMLVGNWLIVIGAFSLAHFWTNPLSILIAMCLIAGRQHGIGVIMHECGHNTLFTSKALNSFFGQWFAAKPVFDDLGQYSLGHSKHHLYAGTANDPDLSNYIAYPVEKASFKRKMIRDITGQTGYRYIAQKVIATFGIFNADPLIRLAAKPYLSMWLTQLAMIGILHFTLSAWLYLLWIGSTMTVYMILIRLRQIAEHAAVPDYLSRDPRLNTRTTHANLIERLFIAPNSVNYHLEHHLMAGVPAYRLKAMHQLLKSRDAYINTRVFANYLDVIRHVTTLPADMDTNHAQPA